MSPDDRRVRRFSKSLLAAAFRGCKTGYRKKSNDKGGFEGCLAGIVQRFHVGEIGKSADRHKRDTSCG